MALRPKNRFHVPVAKLNNRHAPTIVVARHFNIYITQDQGIRNCCRPWLDLNASSTPNSGGNHWVHSRLFMQPLRKRQETDRGAEDNTGQCITNDYVYFSKMFGRRSVEAGLAKSSNRFPSLDSLRLVLSAVRLSLRDLFQKKEGPVLCQGGYFGNWASAH